MERMKSSMYSKLCIILLIYSLMSCQSSNNLNERNYFINKTEFYNDTLNLTGTFLGGIDYYKTQNIDKDELKNAIRGFKRKNLLLHGKSVAYFSIYLFYEKNKKGDKEETKLILNTPERVAFRKRNQQATLTLLLIKNEKD